MKDTALYHTSNNESRSRHPKGAIAILFSMIIFFCVIFFMGLLGIMHTKLIKAKAKNALQNYQLSGQVLSASAIQTSINKSLSGCTATSIPTLTAKILDAQITCSFKLPFINVTPTFMIRQSIP